MSDDRVYVRFKGKTLGPLTLQKVQDLAKRGQITRMHDLSSDGMSWMKAEEFGGVFPSQRIATAAHAANGAAQAVHGAALAETIAFGDLEPAETTNAATMRPGESPDSNVEWYAHIGNENRGPMTMQAMQATFNSGKITRETLVWRAGFDEWKPASDAFPQWFGQVTPMNQNGAGNTPQSQIVISHDVKASDLFYELHRQRPWVLLLSGILITIGTLTAIFWLAFMIANAESKLNLALSGGVKVIVGLIGLAFAGVVITSGWLLLRYAAALKDIAIHRNTAMPTEAARRLFFFWRFVGIAILTVFGGYAALIMLLAALGMGFGAGAV